MTILDDSGIQRSLSNSNIRVRHWDGVTEAGVDRTSKLQGYIQDEHHHIHEKKAYFVILSTDDIGALPNDTLQIYFTTPSFPDVMHTVFDLDSGGEVRVTLTESSNCSGGTLISSFNRDRVAPVIASETLFYSGGSVPSLGTKLKDYYVGQNGQNSNFFTSGSSRARNEIDLAQDTQYCISLYSTSAITGSIAINWYVLQEYEE